MQGHMRKMDKNEEPDFLPNLGNEMTGEQIELHNKVKKNE